MKLYTVEIRSYFSLITTMVKAKNPDEALWLLFVEFEALGQYDMNDIRMRIINEQAILPSV